MDITSFIFGILAVAVVIFVTVSIVSFVMIMRLRKENKENLQEELSYRNEIDKRFDETHSVQDSNITSLRSYIDSRLDKLSSQINKEK